MTRMPTGLILATSTSLFFGTGIVAGETSKAILQPQERAMIEGLLQNSPDFSEAVKGKKVVASTMVRYKEKPEEAATESEFVEVLYFNYDDGNTIRAVYNLTEKKIVMIEAMEAYPTPLASEEIAQAKKLAEETNEKVKVLMRKYKNNQVAVQALAPVIADKSDKRYGKRLAILIFTPKEKLVDSVSVTVNLTDKTVL